ncbi:uncharacterized protein LOC110990663 isoform X2 [Acanthaster planci]|uniref:Uncharacterized protein LOC110990663 isoform X2 n=1 Tax=Acanthaster planci TaxID=133434 RepID=A0A8B8A256_ACAPL|nr:uncharacterized protein LOC110990663 isoform X2 [Acanthaster planci]
MLQGMERWLQPGVTGNDTGRNSRGVDRLYTAGSSGSSIDERIGLESVGGRSRSNSLPIRAQSQSEYLDSIRALAEAYSTVEQHRKSGGHATGAVGELGTGSGYLTRSRSATMTDVLHYRAGRTDSQQTVDSSQVFDRASPQVSDVSEVFLPPASDDEKARIINSRLQELDSAQRSWKRRVADYVHGLPSTKPLPGEGGRIQDPKRRRIWSTGERLPWEIRSSDGVSPRQRITTVSSDSTYSCSQLSTSSSRDSIQLWVDSIDGQEGDPDITLTPGQVNGDHRKSIGSLLPANRKISDSGNGIPKRIVASVEDDLGLGADAGSVTGSIKGEDATTNQVTGPGGKTLAKKLTNSDIINLANQTKALQSRRKQLQRMGSSAMSDASVASVSDLLYARNDPEELLLSLGFGGGKEPNPLDRIPGRFLQQPSMAQGISVDNYLMLSETQDQKYGFSLHGGLRGLGAVLQQSMCAITPSAEQLVCQTDVGGVMSWPTSRGEKSVSPVAGNQPLAEPVRQGTLSVRPVSPGGELPRTDLQVLNLQPDSVGETDLTRPRSGLNISHKAKDASSPTSPSSSHSTSSVSLSPAIENEPNECVFSGQVRVNSFADSSHGYEFVSDSSDSDWDYEEVDSSAGSLRPAEEHRRSRLTRMVMPEPLLPPVREELEVSQSVQSVRPPAVIQDPSVERDLQCDPREGRSGTGNQPLTEGSSPKRGVELSTCEKRASQHSDRPTHRLAHNQESFEIEEISSTENQEDGTSANRAADKTPEKEPLVRTDSAQSDSSGFADEVMDSTITPTSTRIDDCSGSPQQDNKERNGSGPEMGNKLIQTSFDDFGVLESFEWEEGAQETGDAISGQTAKSSFEEDKNSMSEQSSVISSAERIARSRKSFRESRSSYDRMGSTFSGISISSLEDSPFDGEGPPLPIKTVPVPRQRSGTYPTTSEKQEVAPGPKTVVEILTTLQENIKQATEAKKFIEDQEAGNAIKKRPTLSKMKSVDFDYFPLDDIHVPSLMESVEAILGHSNEVSNSITDEAENQNLTVVFNSPEDSKAPSSVSVAENGVAEEICSCRSSPKLLKRKSSQIIMIPTLPCLDEEKTPVHSRHSSVTDSQHAVPKQNSSGHCADADKVSETTDNQIPANLSPNARLEEPILTDTMSDTDTPVSMVANVDSVGDVGDLEEEMLYLEHVESLLQEQGRLLEGVSPPRSHARPKIQEEQALLHEEVVVSQSEATSESYQAAHSASEPLDQFVTTVEVFSSVADQPFHKHSGAYLSSHSVGDKEDIVNTTVIPKTLCPVQPTDMHRTSLPTKLVESSVYLYLSPRRSVGDVPVVPSSIAANEDNVLDTEKLCNCSKAESAPHRYRTSFELDLDTESPKETCNKKSQNSTESITRIKPEDDLHDMKLLQRALFKYKQDLCELESLAERLYARHLDEDGETEFVGAMTEWERAELDSVRSLRRQVLEEVEIMEGRLSQRMTVAVARVNSPDGLENSLATASEDNLEVIQEMVNLLEEQRSLRRMLLDLETTHSHATLSEASTIPDLSVVQGSPEWAESYQGEVEGEEDTSASDRQEMMEALMEVRLELQHQREMARREMNSAVKEAKDKEIEQLKGLLREQRRLQEGE